jgi:hypothetical protein
MCLFHHVPLLTVPKYNKDMFSNGDFRKQVHIFFKLGMHKHFTLYQLAKATEMSQ